LILLSSTEQIHLEWDRGLSTWRPRRKSVRDVISQWKETRKW
jgi:hypothetical protein